MGRKMFIDNVREKLVELGEDIDKVMVMEEEYARALLKELRDPKAGAVATQELADAVEDVDKAVEDGKDATEGMEKLSDSVEKVHSLGPLPEELMPDGIEVDLSSQLKPEDVIMENDPSYDTVKMCGGEPQEDPKNKDDIMDMFNDDEVGKVDGNKYVKVAGLRRVAKKVIGPIVGQSVSPYPITIGNYSGVMVTMAITFCTAYGNDDELVTAKYSDAADCIPDFNSDVEEFGKYPTALATTRAEARIYRKALGLDIVSYEEMSETTPENFGQPKGDVGITPTQMTVIKTICKKKGLILKDIIEAYDKTKKTLKDFSHKDGIKFVGHLNRKKDKLKKEEKK